VPALPLLIRPKIGFNDVFTGAFRFAWLAG
jgi:hypothetical protein